MIPPRQRNFWLWLLIAMLLVVLVAIGLRRLETVLDADVAVNGSIGQPTDGVADDRWSIESSLGLDDTGGPAVDWLQAVLREVFGEEIGSFQLVSVLLFTGGVLPLLLICRQIGMSRGQLLIVAALYIILPYNLVLAQLLLSEASFLFGALWLLFFFVWGFSRSGSGEHRTLGPIFFGVVLALLLHHRVHALAFAGAACLTALERDRLRSWPWWLASVLAGLSRLPLWLSAGGPRSPRVAEFDGLNLALESLTYLAAALVPFVAIFLWPALARPEYRSRRWMVLIGAAVGIVLAIVAAPNLSEMLALDQAQPQQRFAGITGSLVRYISDTPAVQTTIVSVLAVAGAMSLGAIASIAFAKECAKPHAVVMRLIFWTILCGCGMHALADGPVHDHHILPWAVLLPIAWFVALPKQVLAVQAVELVGIFALITGAWLTG